MSQCRNLLSSLQCKRQDLLRRITDEISAPGFIGPIPYLLLLRWIVVVGVALRFWLHRDDYVGGQSHLVHWGHVLIAIVATAVVALIATFLTARPHLRQSKRIQAAFIAVDVVLISLLYFMTGNIQSDFFLFYYLPIFSATEYLGSRGTLVVSGGITLTFFMAIASLLPSSEMTPALFANLILRVFLPRMLFFVSIVMTSSFFLSLERTQRRKASLRKQEVQAFLDFKAEVDQVFDVDRMLQHMIRRAVKISRAVGGHVCLIDYETGQLQVRFHTQRGYLRETLSLKVIDSLAEWVVQHRESHWIDNVQSDSTLGRLFDPRIHSVLCVPIVAHDTVLGTLSVGRVTYDPFDTDVERFLQGLAGQIASAIERARLLVSLAEIGNATASALELDAELDAMLKELTEGLRFEFATVSLVDDYRQVVETIRGKNVPQGWIARARHALDSPDIQAHVVHTGNTEIVEGWDERLDREIYERFGHANLARIFAPIVANGVVVGTLEAGCQRDRRADILTAETVQSVERLGLERGAAVAQTRPCVLLELIANRAIKIIGADSASVHVYQSGQSLLVAGAGRATKDFLIRLPPRDGGIGWQAMRDDHPVLIDDSSELADRNGDLFKEGVKAIAAFPLSLGTGVEGVLYVHFWREHRFSQAELELEKVFAHQIEVAIQNSLLLRGISEAVQRAWTLSRLQNMIQSIASGRSVDLTQVLDDIARNVLIMLDADNVILYQYDQAAERFQVPPVMQGSFRRPEFLQIRMSHDAAVYRVVQGGQSHFVSDVSCEPLLSGARRDGLDRPRFVEREELASTAAVILRARETDEIVGLMFVNYRRPHQFTDEDKRTINALASSAAMTIETARLYERQRQSLERRETELMALRAVDQLIVATAPSPDLQIVLSYILEMGTTIIEAQVGGIMWFNRWNNVLELRACRGIPEERQMIRMNIGEGIAGLAAEKKKSILAHDLTAEKWRKVGQPLAPDTRSALAVPLVDESGLLGVLSVEHPEVGAFTADDRTLLETLAVQAVIAIHSVDLHQKLERQIRSLRSLSMIASRVQDARYDLDTVLRLLLTGVTTSEGVGFSRAMLFLTDDQETNLQGRIAAGAQTHEEAEAIWNRVDQIREDLEVSSEDVLSLLLDQAEEFSTAIAEGKQRDCSLSTAIQGICMPIERGAGAPLVCMLEARTIIVEDAQADPFRVTIERETQSDDTGDAFVCAPLVCRGKTLGVLVADNRFLPSEREIEPDAVSCLETFANVISMSIENARLQRRLEDEQRLKTWREFTARIAHIIGTRIAVIKDTVTQARFSLSEAGESQGTLAGEPRTWLGELANGIYRAEIVLRDFRQFAKPLQLKPRELDLVQVMQAMREEIEHSLDFPVDMVARAQELIVKGDDDQLFHAFTELVRNGQEAMWKDACRLPRMIITLDEQAAPAGVGSVAQIEFANTGPGIPEEDKKRIFEPFFSTKSRGSGLGLAIVRDIIEEHRGTIEEIGNPEEGARFIVCLPLVE